MALNAPKPATSGVNRPLRSSAIICRKPCLFGLLLAFHSSQTHLRIFSVRANRLVLFAQSRDFGARIAKLFGGVDVVINFTGGETWQPSLRCVKRGGKILVCGATAGYDPKEDLRYIWSFEIQIIGSNSFYDDNLTALMDFIQQDKMKPVIDSTLPLDRAIDGLRMIENREVFGKVVVIP